MVSKAVAQDKLQNLYFITSVHEQDVGGKFLLFVHALNQAAGLRCTGLLEDDPEDFYEIPQKWNQPSHGVYSLRYKSPEKKNAYFKFIKSQDNVSVNAAFEDQLYSVTTKLSPLELKTVDDAKNADFLKTYQAEVLDKLAPPTQSEAQKPPQQSPFFLEPNPVDDRNMFWNPQRPRNDPPQPNNPFGAYGRSDLDPFGGAQGPFPLGANSGGNLLGPNNPIFLGGPQQPNNPNLFRYDPVGPGFDMDIDNDLFVPQQPFKNPRGGFGGRGGFGAGRGGFGGFGDLM